VVQAKYSRKPKGIIFMRCRSGQRLTGIVAAALLATLAIGTLPAQADDERSNDTSTQPNVAASDDPDQLDLADQDGVDQDNISGDQHDSDQHGDHPKPRNGLLESRAEDGQSTVVFRLAMPDGTRCLEGSGKLVACSHQYTNQLWNRIESDRNGRRLVNIGARTCLGAYPEKKQDVQQEQCTRGLEQKWIPFGGTGQAAAPFGNARFRAAALGRDRSVHLVTYTNPAWWLWLAP
jgi:hypothetical protein